jgi:predicted RecA/RadA family phage recombinase
MKNFIQKGEMVTVTAPAGGVTSGQGVIVGSLFGIAAKNATAGESVELATTGVFDLPKAPSAVIAAGARVSWDAENGQVVLPADDMYPIGIALLAAGNGTITARVRLDGMSTAAA